MGGSKMIKLKDLIKESTWDNRKFGEPLPTMEDYKKAHEGRLTEKRKMDDKALLSIKKMTDRNQHTENRRKLSSLMGNDKLHSFYEAMATLNKVFNGFPSELSKLNQKMEKELYKQIKKSYLNAEEIIGLL